MPNLTSEFRVIDGVHDWDVWGPTFAECAGGIATDALGNVCQAVSGTDVSLVKYNNAEGSRAWTQSVGSNGTDRAYGVAVDANGRVVVTGFTNGDLDATHAGEHLGRRVRGAVRR
ncbi:hypothetical protein [Kribbella sp.]|uniref:hypothetical protein n=1 Tax=Kribbella sp. TaxID=1871183 RepID=UPI002D34C1B4|nr:hypothetical protein [Kribbella sp.]HZX05814.1 hypothetical protein [Kribbella sp.]